MPPNWLMSLMSFSYFNISLFFFLCGQNPATMYSLYRKWNTTQLYYEYIGIMIITNKPLQGCRKMNQPVIFENITSGFLQILHTSSSMIFLGAANCWFQATMQQLLAADFRRFKRRGKNRSTGQFVESSMQASGLTWITPRHPGSPAEVWYDCIPKICLTLWTIGFPY